MRPLQAYFIILALNIAFVIGMFTLGEILGSNNDQKLATHTPVLAGIDARMDKGDYAGALEEIDVYFEPEGMGGFQMGLAGRKITCLTYLNRHAEARRIIDRLIATFPIMRDMYHDAYHDDLQPNDYALFGGHAIEAGQVFDETLSQRFSVTDLFTHWTPKRLFFWIGVNVAAVAFYQRWRTRQEK